MSTHTPGPWVAHQFGYGAGLFVVTDPPATAETRFSGHVIASQTTCPDWQANARLIAAAPELLCMLERVMGEICMTETGMQHVAPLTLEQARRAIEKATT